MPELRLGQAVALGVLHGPAELLPISSSGHVTLVPWLLGWEYGELEPNVRKSLEVALHAGTAAALLVTQRGGVIEALRTATPRLGGLIALSFLPPAAAGWLLEGPIERRLGRPESVAAGLVIGSMVMLWSDRRPQLRTSEEATPTDALWLGAAQACALVPGVSRNGATLSAARIRSFTRASATLLSRHVAFPIIAAATARQLVRLQARVIPPAARKPLAGGAAASFLSTLGAARVLGRLGEDWPLLPYAGYRLALAALVIRRLQSGRSPTMRS